MKILRIYPTSINERFINEAVGALRNHEVIIYPTDSVYALGCDALNSRAIEKLCALKGINPRKDMLSIICSDLSMASEYVKIDNSAFRYMKEYLPGPFTFILPSSTHLPKIFRDRRTIGVRIPDNPITIALCETLGGPLLTTSVALEPLIGADPEAVALAYASKAEFMIDGGGLSGTPTAIINLTDSSSPELVREGSIPFEP